MQQLILFSLLFILGSCASLNDFEYYKNDKGIYSVKRKKLDHEITVLRDKNKNVIRDEEVAKNTFYQFMEVEDIDDNQISNCDAGITQSKAFHKIDKHLANKQVSKAKSKLKNLKKSCKNLEYHSKYYFTLAYINDLEGNIADRNKNLKSFINKSDAIYPSFTMQTDSKGEAASVYKQYVQHAHAVLNGSEFTYDQAKEKKLKIARYRDRTNSFLPGYENETGRMLLILPGYSSVTGGAISALYNIKTEYGEFIPTYTYNEIQKGQAALIYRKRLSQSLDRRHTTGINVSLFQWKIVNFNRNYYTNEASNIEVEDEGIGLGLGYSGTYQLTNDFLYIYQARATSSDKVYTAGTSLIAFSLVDLNESEPLLLEYGLFNDVTIIGVRLGFIQMFQDFSNDSFNFRFHLGF